jgi:hypothetical protein
MKSSIISLIQEERSNLINQVSLNYLNEKIDAFYQRNMEILYANQYKYMGCLFILVYISFILAYFLYFKIFTLALYLTFITFLSILCYIFHSFSLKKGVDTNNKFPRLAGLIISLLGVIVFANNFAYKQFRTLKSNGFYFFYMALAMNLFCLLHILLFSNWLVKSVLMILMYEYSLIIILRDQMSQFWNI